MYRYAIRNTTTGSYIHKTLMHIRLFYSLSDAIAYMIEHKMSMKNYEVVKVEKLSKN